MPIAGPFYFAWVEPTETTFNSSHLRMDEYVFSAVRTIAEGEKPLLQIEIQNPHVGMLSPTRKYWAWFSWNNGSAVVPLFFGRVVGTPVEIFDEVLSIQLVADPIDYKKRVQRVAETMKVRPFYDQVFIDVARRDDPDTILEGYSKVWDVNPITHLVTANDLLEGDSNVDFDEDDHFYDNMNMTVGQPPATAILMDASVSWLQTSRGVVDLGNKMIQSYSGDGIISEWPKPLQDLGSGWSVYYSNAVDIEGVGHALSASFNFNWQNQQKEKTTGDTESVSVSMTVPMCNWGIWQVTRGVYQTGILDPYAVDEDGDPEPLNIPMSIQEEFACVPIWTVQTSLVLQYDAQRQRTERVIFLVRADTQAVLVDPELSEESETLTKSGVDVGIPIINLLNWTSVSGEYVAVGQIIFPDNPDVPGGRSVQICVNDGVAGTDPPDFSDVVGFETDDGTVTWASLGQAAPTENAVEWTGESDVPLGQIILPRRPFFISYSTLLQPGKAQSPPSGVPVAEGQIVQGAGPYFWSGTSFQVCTLSGTTGSPATDPYNWETTGLGGAIIQEPPFSSSWGTVTGDGTIEWTSLGPNLPSGSHYFICTKAGRTGPVNVIPPFNNTLHAVTTDGSVEWTCIGPGEIPIGGITGDVRGASYFTTDRGRESLEYLASVVRARLIWRARCVDITFGCSYLKGSTLTTRQTVTLHDPRIAGGMALGKVKSTVLSVSDSGEAICQVALACCAGLGNTIADAPGEPTYVQDGYVQDYQQRENEFILLPNTTDLSYAKPKYVANDDGITFPVTKEMVLIKDEIHMTASDQVPGIYGALTSMRKAANLPQPMNIEDAKRVAQQMAALSANSVGRALSQKPVWQEYIIKPINGGPFNKVYNVKFSRLVLPRGVDLQSSGVT